MKQALAAAGIATLALGVAAQDRLPHLPGYDRYQSMTPLIGGSWTSGSVVPRWEADSRSFTYTLRGKNYRFDMGALSATEAQPAAAAPASARGAGPGRSAATGRGRQSSVPLPRDTGGTEQAQQEMPRTPI